MEPLHRSGLSLARAADSVRAWRGRRKVVSQRQVFARRRVHRTMEALGGHDSAAGSVVWHVVGGGMSVRAWARRQRWGGRPVRPDQAHGVLMAALSVLAANSAI
jgi:hypothetical protein